MKKKVLITEHIHEAGVDLLRGYFEVECAGDLSLPELQERIVSPSMGDFHGILVRSIPITKQVIERAENLLVISRHGAGFDNVDIEAATARNIPVTYAPAAVSLSVAEHALAVIGALAKRLLVHDRAVRENRFHMRNQCHAEDLHQKTLGIIGLGRIGTMVCERANAAYGMSIIAYDPFVPKQRFEKLNAAYCSKLAELLERSDYVSLHVPLNRETRKLIGREELAVMKPTAFLVNISRGDVVDEAALIECLSENRIAGAAIDVFEKEPPDSTNPLFELENIILTPHSGGLTKEAVLRIATDAAQGIIDVLSGKRPRYVVNPEVLENRQ